MRSENNEPCVVLYTGERQFEASLQPGSVSENRMILGELSEDSVARLEAAAVRDEALQHGLMRHYRIVADENSHAKDSRFVGRVFDDNENHRADGVFEVRPLLFKYLPLGRRSFKLAVFDSERW